LNEGAHEGRKTAQVICPSGKRAGIETPVANRFAVPLDAAWLSSNNLAGRWISSTF
jgi:hypothetical protein